MATQQSNPPAQGASSNTNDNPFRRNSPAIQYIRVDHEKEKQESKARGIKESIEEDDSVPEDKSWEPPTNQPRSSLSDEWRIIDGAKKAKEAAEEKACQSTTSSRSIDSRRENEQSECFESSAESIRTSQELTDVSEF